jgi:hypothetical protein
MASSIKYFLFLFVFLALVGGEVIFGLGSSFISSLAETSSVVKGGSGLITANVTTDAPNPGSLTVILIITFLIISVIGWYKLKDKKCSFLITKGHFYAAIILRIVLGVFLIISGFDITPTLQGYALGILLMIAGIILIFGLFLRPTCYLVFFYLATLLFKVPSDTAVTFLLMVVTVVLFLLGQQVRDQEECPKEIQKEGHEWKKGKTKH